jgi:hypothetical protein
MKKTTFQSIIGLSAALALASCSSNTETINTASTTSRTNGTNAAAVKTDATNSASVAAANHNIMTKSDEDAPTTVKAVFPDAQSITKQHKDIPNDMIADIEKDAGGRVPDIDHHSYLAFSSASGTRKQIGAATVVKVNDKDVVVVYDSKNGLPVIREIRADGVPANFLKQFAGKGHDDKLQFGADLKANGIEEETAKAITEAVRVDALTMQALYGAAHSH